LDGAGARWFAVPQLHDSPANRVINLWPHLSITPL
jgi:hypothetical protein